MYRVRPIIPDVIVSLDPPHVRDFSGKIDQSFFVWHHGRPNLAIEIMSATYGGEHDSKPEIYGNVPVPLYVIWDPDLLHSKEQLYV